MNLRPWAYESPALTTELQSLIPTLLAINPTINLVIFILVLIVTLLLNNNSIFKNKFYIKLQLQSQKLNRKKLFLLVNNLKLFEKLIKLVNGN